MSMWLRTQGDINDTIEVELISRLVNLALVSSVVAHVWFEDSRGRSVVAAVDLAAAVTDVANRVVTVQLGNASGWLATLTQVGDWFVELQVTFIDGKVETWPSGAPRDVIRVQRQGK